MTNKSNVEVSQILKDLYRDGLWSGGAKISPKHTITQTEAKSALRDLLIKLLPEKHEHMPFDRNSTRFDGYNQALADIKKIIEEVFE